MIQITDKDCEDVGIIKRAWCDTNIASLNPFDTLSKDRFSLSAHFVSITCSDMNKDVMCNLAGKKGTGKSYSTVSLGEDAAKFTAIALDNDINKWKDYFDIERNVAIMDSDKMIDILTSKEKHQVIISDDSGTIQGARKFMSEENQLMNSVMVVNRTLNNIYFSSAPESKHVDRQARDLPEHQLDFINNPAGMANGFATCKYFEKITNPKTSESYFQYHYWKNMKVLRCLIHKPSKELSDEYDRLREKGRDLQQQRLKEAKERRIAKEQERLKKDIDNTDNFDKLKERNNKRTEDARKKAMEMQPQIDDLVLHGMTLKEALRELHIPISTYKYWKDVGFI